MKTKWTSRPLIARKRYIADDTGEIIVSTATTGEQIIANLKLFALAPRMAEALIELMDSNYKTSDRKEAWLKCAAIVAELEKINS